MACTLPLGEGTVEFSLPDCTVTVAEPAGGDAVDVTAAARDAVAAPHGPRLADAADGDDNVVIVVTDVTRATPEARLLDVLVAELGRAGVDRDQVTVLLGLGLHRPMTEAEIEASLGEFAPLAVNHDPDATVRVGTVDDCPIEVHRRVADADLVVSTGMVEPHQYAGFSGGAKTVAIGAGGESLIRYTHGPDLLSRDGVRLGRIDGNPFRDVLDRAGDVLGLDFCLNVTRGPAGVLGVSAGRPRAVVRELADVASEALSVPVADEYDAVVAGVGAPKDATLYQTTRAATYVILGDRNPLRPDGRVVLPAELSEGAGEGTGEQRFYRWLSEATSAAALYERMRDGYEPGAQRAFVLARALCDHDVYVTNSRDPAVVEASLMRPAETVPEAVEPGSDVLVVPDGLDTLLVGPE
jgi:nickel-dependent lactate racemase